MFLPLARTACNFRCQGRTCVPCMRLFRRPEPNPRTCPLPALPYGTPAATPVVPAAERAVLRTGGVRAHQSHGPNSRADRQQLRQPWGGQRPRQRHLPIRHVGVDTLTDSRTRTVYDTWCHRYVEGDMSAYVQAIAVG